MSVSSAVNRLEYNGDGTTAAFTTPIYYSQNHLKVYEVISNVLTLRTLGSHYTVSPTTNTDGTPAAGTVTFATGYVPASGTKNVIILNEPPNTQLSDITSNDDLPANTVEKMADLAVMNVITHEEVLSRCLKAPKECTLTAITIPNPQLSTNAGKVLALDATSGVVGVSASSAAFTSPLTTKGDLVTHNGTSAERLAVGTNGYFLKADSTASGGLSWDAGAAVTAGDGITVSGNTVTALIAAGGILNANFTASVSAKALTFALKTKAGTDPSATDPVLVLFRNATLTTGTPVVRSITSAMSVTLSSGSTVGFSAALNARIYWGFLDDAGTVSMWVSRRGHWSEGAVHSPSAEGGAGAADSATVIYATAAHTNVPIRVGGYVIIETGAVAGEWDNAPTILVNMGPGVHRTGNTVQEIYVSSSTMRTGTNTFVEDNSIPQTGEMNAFSSDLAATVTPTTIGNYLRIEGVLHLAHSGNVRQYAAIVSGASADALSVSSVHAQAVNLVCSVPVWYEVLVSTTATRTYTLYGGNVGGATQTLNGQAGAALLNGRLLSYIRVTEICV